MEGEDDMDSLFAGMDFVNPLDAESPLSFQPSFSAPLDLNDFSDQIQLPKESLTLTPETKYEGSGKPKIGSINTILAAYDSASVKTQPSLGSLPSFHKQSSDASKPGVRRKRRSVKIGYGRSTADDADEVRSVSGQDETASNGSAADDHSTGLPEVMSATQDGISAAGHKALVFSVTNGDHYNNVTSAKDKEPFENIAVFAEPLDIADAELPISEDQVSHVSASAVKLDRKASSLGLDKGAVNYREDESREATPSKQEKTELTEVSPSSSQSTTVSKTENTKGPSLSSHSTIPEESLPMDNEGHVATAQTPVSEKAFSFATQERQSDDLEQHIKFPLGLPLDERLSFIKTAVSKNADCIQERIAAISQSRKGAAQTRRHIAEKISRASVEFKEVEEEMQAACEREDFEKAEQLDEALVLAQKAREAAMEEFIAAETEYDRYSSKMHEVIQLLIANEEEGFSLLEQLRQEAAETASHVTNDSQDVVKVKNEELAASEVSIKSEKEKLMLEVEKVEGAKMELSCTMENSVQEESEEKQRLVDERQIMLQELDALLAAVRLKEAQIAGHDEKIGDLEHKINNRVSGLEQERVKLEADLHELISGLDNLEKELESLDEKKKQVEAEGICAHEAAEKLLELSSLAKAEAQKLQDSLLVRKTAAKTVLSSKEKRLSLAAQEKQHVEDAHGLRDRSSSLRTSLQELASEKVKLQQELLSFNQQTSSIEKRLPEIEAEKKLAAGSRNFKEAGRLAAEAKAFLSSKEQVMAELKRVTEELQVLEQELESHARDLTELESQLQEKEKEAAKARYERLRLLAAATRDERDAASELEDFEEAKSLDVEAAAADKEADEIQQEFGFDSAAC